MTASIQTANSKNSALSVFPNSSSLINNAKKNLVENKEFTEKLKQAQNLRNLEKKHLEKPILKN